MESRCFIWLHAATILFPFALITHDPPTSAKSSIVHLHITILDNWRTPSAFPCCGCLRISSSWICGDDCWPVSESGAENILASDSSSESPTPGWFFVPGKDSSWRFGSAHQNSQLVDGFFSTRDLLALAGVESLSPSAKKETEVKRGRPLAFFGISALCPSELTAVEQFLRLFIGNWYLTVSYGLYLADNVAWGLLQML